MLKKLNRAFGRIAVIFSSIATLTACESVLTQKEIGEKYANSSINAFVKDRYTCPIANKISDKLDRMTGYFHDSPSSHVVAEQQRFAYVDYSNRILADGKSVIYPAPFTSMNDRFLYKPIDEMSRFCSVKGGVLFIKKRFNKYINGLYENPAENYFKVMESNLPNKVNVTIPDIISGSSASMNIPINKNEIAVLAAEGTSISNASSVSTRYQIAYNHNAFGAYACRGMTNGKLLWGVMIKPIGFYPKDPNNDLDSNVLLLLITPIETTPTRQVG